KGDPARVFLAAVAGPPTPYIVELVPPTVTDPSQWPAIAHSCMTSDALYADPAVRIAEAVTAFGSHGLFSSICGDSMGPALPAIAPRVRRPLAPACVPTPDPSGPGCPVVDRWIDDAGARQAARLPSCDVTVTMETCWRLVADDATCGAGKQRLEVERRAT